MLRTELRWYNPLKGKISKAVTVITEQKEKNPGTLHKLVESKLSVAGMIFAQTKCCLESGVPDILIVSHPSNKIL